MGRKWLYIVYIENVVFFGRNEQGSLRNNQWWPVGRVIFADPNYCISCSCWNLNFNFNVHTCSACLFRRVPLVEQELPTLPEHLSSTRVFGGVRVTRSLVLCVCFVDRCLSFCTSSFGYCVVCSSSIYGFWLPPFGIFKFFFQHTLNVALSYNFRV
jgi:hypothetical protein